MVPERINGVDCRKIQSRLLLPYLPKKACHSDDENCLQLRVYMSALIMRPSKTRNRTTSTIIFVFSFGSFFASAILFSPFWLILKPPKIHSVKPSQRHYDPFLRRMQRFSV